MMLAMVAKVVGLGELGRADELGPRHELAQLLTQRSTATGGQRLTFIEFYAWAIDDVDSEGNYPTGQRWIELMRGCALLAEGRTEAAAVLMHSIGLNSERPFDSRGWINRYRIDLEQACAISGRHELAEPTLSSLNANRHPAYEFPTPAKILAGGWIEAVKGLVTIAIAEARRAAAHAQWAHEVVCLQVATRFVIPTPHQDFSDPRR